LAQAESAERYATLAIGYGGGKFNVEKRETLQISGSVGTGKIRVLGVTLTADGIVDKIPKALHEDAAWLRSLSHADGIHPRHLLALAEAKIWPKIGYAASLAAPDPRQLVYEWAKIQRICLNTYGDCHTVIVVRELGISHNPVWFVLKSIHTLCHSARQDPSMHALLQYAIQHEQPLAQHLNRFLRVADITIQAVLQGVPLSVLRVRLTAWVTSRVPNEASRLGILRIDDPLWATNQSAASYLRRPYAKYGTLFRLPHLGIPHTIPAACYFCTEPVSDNGAHLVLHCQRIPVPRPARLTQLWPLSNVPYHASELDTALKWMSQIWQLRKSRRLQHGNLQQHPAHTPRDPSTFFSVSPPRPRLRRRHWSDEDQPLARRQRTTRQTAPLPIHAEQEQIPSTIRLTTRQDAQSPTPDIDDLTPTIPLSQLTLPPIELGGTLITTLPQTPPAHRIGAMNPGGRHRSRWTTEEDDILIRELTVHQQTSPTGLQPALPHRTPTQIRKRIRTQTIQRRKAAPGGLTRP
jgi:hypothetical protein